MLTFTILPHAWVKENYRLKPALRSLFMGLALLFGLASQALAAIINVPADLPTISAAVMAAVAGDEIVVAAGTYNENVVVNKSLTIRSSGGRGVTFINGSTGQLGTILIQADNVVIGGFGKGFTIKGYDNADPAVEYSAVYVDGVRSNLTIRGNELIADGEACLITEFGEAVTNLTVNANIFSGKTFVGAEPAECGFANQFSVHNVPRQLVVIPTGSNITFTSNNITGTAGGTSSIPACSVFGQGNTLVTIDASTVTIRGNTFAGTTTRFGSSLRCRGTNVSIFCNTFNNAGLGAACFHIAFNAGLTALTGGANPNTIAGVASSNTYLNEGAYFTGATNMYRDAAQVTAIPQSPIAANTTVQDNVTNTNTGEKFCSIQSAIDDANTVNGHSISVASGTYTEDVNINKDLTIQGAGMNVCTVSGPKNGAGSTFQVASPGVIIDGFTITRDGNNVADWNNANGTLNSIGVAIQGQANDAEIRNCKITGNRNGIDVNDSDGNNIHNNIITFNRTGFIFRNKTDNTLVNENEITDNWTLGVLFLDASGGDNVPLQSAANCSFNENNISGNWWGQISDRQDFMQSKNFECNWFGTTSPVVSTIDLTEPGYALQIPVAYGGGAVPPIGQPDILGVASANLDYLLFLVSGTDDEPSTNGFQPTPLSCTGGCPGGGVVINTMSNDIFCSIQEAINAASANDILEVAAGTYSENITINKSITLKGANDGTSGCGTRTAESKIENASFTIAADAVTIDGFEFTGTGAQIKSSAGATTWSNITIKNHYIHATTAVQPILHAFGTGGGIGTTNWTISRNKIDDIRASNATAIALFNTTTSTIQDNCITHTNVSFTGRRGINADGLQTTTISGNTIDMGEAYPTGTANTPWAIQISMSDRDATGITMTGNVIQNTYFGVVGLSQRNVTGFTATCNEFTGVFLGFTFNSGNAPAIAMPLMSNITLENNDILSSNRSVFFRNEHSADPNGPVKFNNIKVNKNSLERNTAGFALEAGAGLTINDGQINGKRNWYGSAVYTDVDARVDLNANIDFLPYLVNGNDGDLMSSCFAPDPTADTGCQSGLVRNENTNVTYCFIQEAINAATSGDRLKVSPGTYDEDVDATASGKDITFAPGNSPGCVTINGDYTLNSGDELEMEIEGTTPCTDHDQFIVNGVVTLNGATLTLPMGMYFAQDGDQIVLIDNDLTDAVIGRFAEGNFATDSTNQYYINYEGGSGNDVVLTKCCGALVDLGIFTTILAPVDNVSPIKDVLAGHKLLIKARPTADMVNAIYTQGTFTIRTLATNGVANFAGDNVHSDFGYVQVGSKQTIALYDYFIFNFENGDPDELNWLKMVEYNLLTLTYSCAVGNAVFELVTNPADPNAPVGGKFYQEVNGETNPGAQGIFYAPRVSVTGPGVLAITATSNSPVCETMQIDLNSTTTFGSPTYAPYAWSGPNMYVSALADPIPFTATLAPLTAGIYQVSVTDGNGCTATATTTVVVPATGACVQNETNMPNNYYPTIKQAIDAVATITGDVLNVPAGTWPENVYVNKALTLNGVYEDISCDDVTRTGAESIITGGAGIAVAIQSNNVTISGFQLEGSTGVSSTGFNEVIIKNNKVNVREIGIASTLLVASALDPYSINDNCVDFPVQAFDQQAFNVNPTLSATQAPGVWYTDRYAPAGFVSTGVPTFRLKHSINASDCETCRPLAFQTPFYNTQGRKYDVGGTTAMSIQLYVATGWDVTNKRMAGFWGTALNAGNAISFYPIIEFTSDGSNPRFRGWNGAAFVDMGLPAGFAYDKWYTLNIAIDGTTIRYNVGDLSLILPGNGSVSIANVILQGHNTLAGVTYDINWDNLNTHGSDDTQTAPTVGILLAAASGTDDVTVQDNNVTDGFYGYVLSGVTAASADRTTVKGGTYTNLLQGVAVLNTLDGVNFAPSSVGVENVAFESFGGNYPNIPAANFHAGIYGFTGGSNPAHTVDILIKSVSLKNTGKTSQASAGLYLADFSTGAGNRLNATVTLSTIQDNKNRGVEVRGPRATASVSTSHILGNGADPFGAGGNHGFGIYSGVGAQVTLLNNFIANPAVQISDNVTALYEGVSPAATIIAHDNSIVRNSNGLLANTTSGTINGTNGSTTCNWWGNSNPNVFDEFILGAVTYDPYLPSGVDDDANPANGFQPDVPCQDLTDFYVNDNSLTGDLITFAVGLDAPLTRGTAHRPYRHINAAIGAAANGNTIRVDIGTYSDEQVLVDKDLTILGTDGLSVAKPIVNFLGTPGADLTLFHVTSPGVTIEHFTMDVDLSKLHSAIAVKGANGTGLTVKNNMINPYRSLASIASTYGNRNAISINHANFYMGSTNPTGILIEGNMVTYSSSGNPLLSGSDDAGFRSGAATDEGVGTFTRNTFQTINHDIIARFSGPGAIIVSNNNFNGGGLELAEFNSGTGTLTVTNNDFNGAFANVAVTPNTAVLRLKNNQQNKVTTVSGNDFVDARWAFSLENYKSVTVDANTFTPVTGATDYLHIGVNTKLINSSSNSIMQTTINGTFTKNKFYGSGTSGGTGIGFFNHDSDNDDIGIFTVGTNMNENEFAPTIGVFARLDNQLGSTDPATFPTDYPNTGMWPTTMACWDKDVDLTHNKFDVGSGLQKPLAMNNAQRVLLEAKLFHKPDDACLGKFFQTVEVMAKVFLQGPYDGPSNRMGEALRLLGDFPLLQPHGAINTLFPGSFVEVGNAGAETILAAVKNVTHPDNSIVDWIWLELRDKNNSNTRLFTRSALVQRDGDIVDLDGTSEVAFPNAYQDNYYLMVRHRNHLAAMTAATVDLTNPATMIDFTTAAQATFGTTPTSARRLIKTATYGLWAGNTFPKDLPINGGAFRLLYNGANNDRAPILTKVGFSTPLNVVTGYFIEDVNMNGEVKYSGSNNDRVIILNNVGASTPLNFITQEPNN